MLAMQAGALLDLAGVLRLAGRPAEAAPLARQALALAERKGHVVAAEAGKGAARCLTTATPARPAARSWPPTGGTRGRRPEATPAPLRRDVRLLGRLLGRVLEEAGGPGLLEDVERLRRATIALRAADGGRRQARARVVELVAGFDRDRAELLARAFTVYFQLVNLAEEQHRVRTLRERRQQGGQVRESYEAAVAEVREAAGEDGLARLLGRLEVAPVLTAHPTEARRRAVVDALRRIAVELARLDAPRLPGDDQATATRRLLEEITGLWRTAQLRRGRPSPLDEVRSVMAVFDATLFRLVPATYRALEQAVSGEAAGTGPPPFPAYLRWGSWVGGDRDGNPSVTAETTRAAMAIQADHVLRGLERVTRRVGHALPVAATTTPPQRGAVRLHQARHRRLPAPGRRHRHPLAGRALPPEAPAGRRAPGCHPRRPARRRRVRVGQGVT